MVNLVRTNIAKSQGYIPGEQPSDLRTIKLNTNENPYPPSPRVLEAIRSVTPEQLRRYPNPSARDFRDAAAKIHNVLPDWILTFNGGDELIAVIVRACASESDTVAFFEPSYSLYPVIAKIHGARALTIPYEITDAGWFLPPGVENTKASILLIVNPNAPSGHFTPLAQLESIARNFSGVVLVDEAYVDFASENALSLVREYENIVVLRTLSKGYSLAGLRFGYAIGQPSLLKEIEKVRDSYPCDVISIAAATEAIKDQEYARSTWENVKSERSRMTNSLRDMDFIVPESHSNFVLAQAPVQMLRNGSAQHIYQSLKERDILVRWFDLPNLSDKIRITIGVPEQNDRLLKELQTLLVMS
jgi:histidinol-phosphate aminotransferase